MSSNLDNANVQQSEVQRDEPSSTPTSERPDPSVRSIDIRWAVRGAVVLALIVSAVIAIARPEAPAAAACTVSGRPAMSLVDASLDTGLSLTDSELAYFAGQTSAFARLAPNTDVRQVTVEAVGNVGDVGLVVGGYPSANAPYVVARAIPSFGTIVLFRVAGPKVEMVSSVFEETPAKGSILSVKRTDAGIEVYRDCHFAGEFPLSIDPLLTEAPRLAIEMAPGAQIRRVDLS